MLAELFLTVAARPATSDAPGVLDMRQACEELARGLADEATRRQVSLTLAFSGVLLAAGDAVVLCGALRRLLAAAMVDYSGRAVLITGSMQAGRVRVGILGDGPAPQPSALGVAAHDAADAVASEGGSVEDRTDALNGCVVLRLAPATRARTVIEGQAAPGPAAALQPA